MRRSWVFILTLALLMTLAFADSASAKKSRSKGASSRTGVKRAAQRGRTKPAAARQAKTGRKTYASRSRRGRHRRYQPQSVIASGAPRPSPGIPADRVTEIQTALIKAGYMNGPASGLYDDATIDAMKQFQAENRLSQTGLPSAPLLKKLGVPKRSNDGYAVPVNNVSETDKKRSGDAQPKF